MGAQVAGPCLHWSQLFPAAPSASQTLASVFASICSAKRYGAIYDGSLAHHHVAEHRSPFLGSGCGGSRLSRTRSSEIFTPRGSRGRERQLRRAFSAGLEHLDDDDDDEEEFFKRIREQSADSLGDDDRKRDAEIGGGSGDAGDAAAAASASHFSGTARPAIWPDEPPDWPDRDALSIVAANSGELPLPLRIIKQQQQLRREEGFLRDAGESALSSVKRAFSSMVFIIRELHSFTLHMRELLFYEDLRGILARVHHEMHASFVWLFQHIFSCTPTLMLFLMLLLADFTVYSMAHTVASAAAAPRPDPTPRSAAAAAMVLVESPPQTKQQRFDPASVKSFSAGRTAEVGGSGGGGGGGGKVRPVAGASDEGRSDGYRERRTIVPEGISNVPATLPEEKGVEKDASEEEEDEAVVWNRVVEEASRMRARVTHESLMDPAVLKRLVAPVAVEFEGDDGSTAHFRTELMYQQALSEEPDNSLLLSNFAQFLYLVLRDHDRAEYYFKRAVRIEPADAEALSRYATFLWVARKDLEAAEETYLEAIAADPRNSFYAANYAHFLWNTGGEDTCYPLDTDGA